MTWEQALERWARDQAGQAAPGTIRLRRYWVGRFAAQADTGPWQVTTADVTSWLAQPGWAAETRKSARSSLRMFYRWAMLTDRCQSDPTARTIPVRVPPGRPRPVPDDVYAAALMRADPRTRLMILLAALGGLRCAEIAAVRLDDVEHDQHGPRLRVRGKGDRLRVVPLVDQLHRELLTYTGGRPGWVFPSPAGGHLTPGHVTRLLSAALPPPHTGHGLRHRALTRAYRHGGHDLAAVQTLAGHSSIETTRRYVETDLDALWAAARATA